METRATYAQLGLKTPSAGGSVQLNTNLKVHSMTRQGQERSVNRIGSICIASEPRICGCEEGGHYGGRVAVHAKPNNVQLQLGTQLVLRRTRRAVRLYGFILERTLTRGAPASY